MVSGGFRFQGLGFRVWGLGGFPSPSGSVVFLGLTGRGGIPFGGGGGGGRLCGMQAHIGFTGFIGFLGFIGFSKLGFLGSQPLNPLAT